MSVAGNRNGGASPAYVFTIASVAALGGFIFGYDLNVISPAQLYLEEEFNLKGSQLSFALSSAIFACMLGPVLSYCFCDRHGRKFCFALAGILYAISAIGTALPRDVFTFNLFRMVGGVGVGLASVVTPMYIAEIAPARLRGALVTVNQVAIVVGSTVAIIVCYFLEKLPANEWRWMFASELVPIAGLLGGLALLPQSPRWLVQKNRDKEALAILARVDGEENARREIEEIKSISNEEEGSFRELFSPGVRMALLIAVGLAMFQQWSGASPLTFYAPQIFKAAGFATKSAAIAQTMFMYIFCLVVACLAMVAVDRMGRRPILIFGSLGMALGMAWLGRIFHAGELGGNVLMAMLVAQFFYQGSLAPMAWVVISEIFPTRARTKGQSVATFVIWLSAGLSVYVTEPVRVLLRDSFGTDAGVFWFFGAVCMLSFLFCLKFVPETKGQTIEMIGRQWLERAHHKK